MAKLTLLIDGANRPQHALADRVKAAGLNPRVVDVCWDAGIRYAGADRVDEVDRAIRAFPTLLVDSDDGKRAIERIEDAGIDPAVVGARMRDGTYARADAGAQEIIRPVELPEPGATALARIKAGQGSLADVIEFLQARV